MEDYFPVIFVNCFQMKSIHAWSCMIVSNVKHLEREFMRKENLKKVRITLKLLLPFNFFYKLIGINPSSDVKMTWHCHFLLVKLGFFGCHLPVYLLDNMGLCWAAAKRRKILAITMLSQLMFGGCTHTTIIKWQFLFL